MGTRRRLATLALLLAAAAAFAGVARADLIQSGGVRVDFRAGFTPRALPRERPAPITVEVGGEISTADGSRPPALHRMRVELNSAGQIDTHGLPTCSASGLQATSSAVALARCRTALVGRGSFKAQLSSAGAPVGVAGRALVFNGRAGHRPTMLIHIYVSSPVQLTLVIPLRISHRPGRFGTVLSTKVPPLAGGAGSITELRLRIGRRFRAAGGRRSYLSAACAAPAGFPGAVFPFARGTFRFAGGRVLRGVLTQVCEVRPGRPAG